MTSSATQELANMRDRSNHVRWSTSAGRAGAFGFFVIAVVAGVFGWQILGPVGSGLILVGLAVAYELAHIRFIVSRHH